MTLHELSKAVNRSETTIRSNYPGFVVSLAKKGIFVTRDDKKYPNTNYEIQYGQPKELKKEDITVRHYTSNQIPNEIWKTSFLGDDLEVSNMGRYRWVKNKKQYYTGGKYGDGYTALTYNKKFYPVHRIIMQTFNPIENYEIYSVDHINGKRNDNRLQNLKWCPIEENIMAMMMNRKQLNVELTRIIQIYGYDKTLQILKDIN